MLIGKRITMFFVLLIKRHLHVCSDSCFWTIMYIKQYHILSLAVSLSIQQLGFHIWICFVILKIQIYRDLFVLLLLDLKASLICDINLFLDDYVYWIISYFVSDCFFIDSTAGISYMNVFSYSKIQAYRHLFVLLLLKLNASLNIIL